MSFADATDRLTQLMLDWYRRMNKALHQEVDESWSTINAVLDEMKQELGLYYDEIDTYPSEKAEAEQRKQ